MRHTPRKPCSFPRVCGKYLSPLLLPVMFKKFVNIMARRSSSDMAQRPRRKWRYMFSIIFIGLIFGIAIFQFLMGFLLFNYAAVPQALMVGEILAIVAVCHLQPVRDVEPYIANFSQSGFATLIAVFHVILSHRFRLSGGRWNKRMFSQTAFFWILNSATTIFWVTTLTGFYIFAKKLSVCVITAPADAFTEIPTTYPSCTVYQISVGGSIAGLYVFF